MKKNLKILFLIVVSMVFYGCDFKYDDTDDKTYNKVVYDSAYYNSKPDGLRAKAYSYYLFSTSENKVLNYTYSSAGTGISNIYEGTFEGTLNDKIEVSLPKKYEKSLEFTFDKYNMYDSDKNEYTKVDVVKAVNMIKEKGNLVE